MIEALVESVVTPQLGLMTEGKKHIKENFKDWARRELKIAGLFDKDSDYDGAIGDSVMKLVNAFSDDGHSGFSAGMVSSIFNKLSQWKPLDPYEPSVEFANDLGEYMGPDAKPKTHYQCQRCPSVFSDDGGVNWYDLDSRMGTYVDEQGISYQKIDPAKKNDYHWGPKAKKLSKGEFKTEAFLTVQDVKNAARQSLVDKGYQIEGLDDETINKLCDYDMIAESPDKDAILTARGIRSSDFFHFLLRGRLGQL